MKNLKRLIAAAGRLAIAGLRWRRAGQPLRTQSNVTRIYAICVVCKFSRPTMEPEALTCLECDCRLTPTAGDQWNKLALATEHCPKKFW